MAKINAYAYFLFLGYIIILFVVFCQIFKMTIAQPALMCMERGELLYV